MMSLLGPRARAVFPCPATEATAYAQSTGMLQDERSVAARCTRQRCRKMSAASSQSPLCLETVTLASLWQLQAEFKLAVDLHLQL